MAKDTFISRYSIIINRLQKGPATSDELMRCLKRESEIRGLNFNISQRTLQRDFLAIQQQFNIEIENEKKGERRYIINNIEQSQEISKRLLESFQMNTIISSAQSFADTVFIESRQAKGLEHFTGLLHAINNKFIVNFSYQNYWQEEGFSVRKVHPLGLKESQGRWYVVAADTKDGKTKTFGLDRIGDLDISNIKFREKYYTNLKNAFAHCFGIVGFEDEAPQKVLLAFTPHQGKYVKTFPLHHSQVILNEDKEKMVIQLTIYPTFDFEKELLSFGDDVKILEPLSLVKSVKNRLKNALKQYDEHSQNP